MKICVERIKTGYIIIDADGERHSAETIKRAFVKLRELFGLSTEFQSIRAERKIEIERLLQEGDLQKTIARKVGCSESLVSSIARESKDEKSVDDGDDPDRAFKPFLKNAFSTRPKDHDG